jgi:hypothetical protein
MPVALPFIPTIQDADRTKAGILNRIDAAQTDAPQEAL